MSNLTYIAPFFIVADIKKSVSFYVGQLGFELRYMGPEDDPFFAIVGRDDISLMLKSAGEPVPNHTLHQWARWDAFIHAGDPEVLFEEYRLAGVPFRQALRDDDDGLRGFEVADTDGYILFFGRPKT
jgi:catechol 2,3-dioxygenase-like lactoylglutathione lyase family enzyme